LAMTKVRAARRAGRPTAEAARMKHEALLEAAFAEFARSGFRGASMRDIAENAQISSRTLYNRYPDKLALFEACVELAADDFEPIPADPEADLRSWLVAYTIAMHSQLMSERSRQISLLVYREGSEFDELRQIARSRFEQLQVAPVTSVLTRHGVSGNAAHYLATHFVGVALAEWQRRLIFGGSPMTPAEIAIHARNTAFLFLEGANALVAGDWQLAEMDA